MGAEASEAESKSRQAPHLSQIETRWATLLEALSGPGSAAQDAQRRLIGRYSNAIYRYLLACVRDTDAVDELFQEFALRFVRGDFRRVDAARGRFRDFLKTSLYHLVVDQQRRRRLQTARLVDDPADSAAASRAEAESDREFLSLWRSELMENAWKNLQSWERQTGQPLFTVLRYRLDHPEKRSSEMAAELQRKLGKTVSDGWVRKRLHFAREKLSDLIVQEVALSLGEPTPEVLEQELIDLDLINHCRSALKRRSSL
jgi:RNA polymerase sigma-70 factor (ECF subfamily)